MKTIKNTLIVLFTCATVFGIGYVIYSLVDNKIMKNRYEAYRIEWGIDSTRMANEEIQKQIEFDKRTAEIDSISKIQHQKYLIQARIDKIKNDRINRAQEVQDSVDFANMMKASKERYSNSNPNTNVTIYTKSTENGLSEEFKNYVKELRK